MKRYIRGFRVEITIQDRKEHNRKLWSKLIEYQKIDNRLFPKNSDLKNRYRYFIRDFRYALTEKTTVDIKIWKKQELVNSYQFQFKCNLELEKLIHQYMKTELIALRNRRLKSRQLKTNRRSVGMSYIEHIVEIKRTDGSSHYYNNLCSVHSSPGQFLKLQSTKYLSDYFKSKKPTTDDNHIGVEIECLVNVDDKMMLAQRFHDVNGNLNKHVLITFDGSVGRNDGQRHLTAYEIVICGKETEIKSLIVDVMSVLNQFDAEVNQSCGLHVHLDCRNRSPQGIFTRLFKFQAMLYNMNPKSRKNGYSKRGLKKDFHDATNGCRYVGINARAFYKHKTIEARMHSGTTSANKVNNWIDLLLKIANVSDEKLSKIKRCPRNMDNIANILELDYPLKNYIKERIAKFAA